MNLCSKCTYRKVYKSNKWNLCITCYRLKLKNYKSNPTVCSVSDCSIALFMRNDSGLCQAHFHKEYMKSYQMTGEQYIRTRTVSREYKKNNAEKIYLAQKQRELEDINFKIKRRLRHRIYCALRFNTKVGSAVKDLGCSIEEFKQYLESKFVESMTWENYGKWHIDHVVPLDSFNLSNREELLLACHYTNLQPLWAKDNLVKSNKIVQEI